MQGASTSLTKSLASTRLLDVLSDYDSVLVVTHDNPDPDAIASGWAVLCLIEERLGRPCQLIGGGAIVRAENKHMVELLGPPIELIDDIATIEGAATILVDCQHRANNQLLTRQAIKPVAVIDHHLNGNSDEVLRFRDVRPDAAATASIAASYLREQRIEPGCKLATGLLYAMRTETCGYETDHSPLDREMLVWLTESADPGLLAEIENAPLSREYFGDLVLAMQNTFLYDDVAFCLLPRAAGPEIVGEVADLLVRGEGISSVFCGAVVGNDLLVSVRTSRDEQNAAQLLRETLVGLGSGGGHAHRAGGKVCGVGRAERVSDEMSDKLRSRWLKSCRVKRKRGTRLVALREIVDNL